MFTHCPDTAGILNREMKIKDNSEAQLKKHVNIYFVYVYTVFGVSPICHSTYAKFRGKVGELAASFHHMDLWG